MTVELEEAEEAPQGTGRHLGRAGAAAGGVSRGEGHQILGAEGLPVHGPIAELAPGRGYYTRILAKAVGPTGKVYAVVTNAQAALRWLEDQDPPAVVVVDKLETKKVVEDGEEKEQKLGVARRLLATVGVRDREWHVVEILALKDPDKKESVPLEDVLERVPEESVTDAARAREEPVHVRVHARRPPRARARTTRSAPRPPRARAGTSPRTPA